MQLKKLIPACLALVMLCGCSSGSNDSTKKDNKSNKTETSETVDTKDLTTVKGTMNVPEDFKNSNLEGTTIEYTVDKEGLVHTINFHQVSGLVSYDGDKIADSNGKEIYYIEDSDTTKLNEWKKNEEKDAKVNEKGYNVTLVIGDKMPEELANATVADTHAYYATYDYSFDSSKANKSTTKKCAESLNVKIKNSKITEKSLKEMLEVYYMTYTNE